MKAANRKATEAYANYGKYYVRFDSEKKAFSCGYAGRGDFWRDVKVTLIGADGVYEPDSFRTSWRQPDFEDYTLLTACADGDVRVKVVFRVKRDGIYTSVKAPKGYTAHFVGSIDFGQSEECFACRLRDGAKILRSASGPATSSLDDSVFDRATDSAVMFSKAKPNLKYDWEQGKYIADLCGNSWKASVKEHVYESGYMVPYKPINKGNTFPKPQIGWMTWYSVMFDACEKAVLDNAERMKELFGKYGADTVWVDWEWYNSAISVEGPRGIDYFHPDPVRYPHGLKYVADKISGMGLVPALWIGVTHEPGASEFMERSPDSVLSKDTVWCGEYIYDPTDENYLGEYLPQAIDKVKEWNFGALKWDCLPITLWQSDRYHNYLSDNTKTSEEALREAVKLARERLGEDFYMLSCAGAADREIRFAADMFDAARIGGDIFSWQDFINHLANRIVRFYLYHNVLFYCDPDNVVLREQFNTPEQAVSRASLVTVLGLPYTMGDDLTKLSPERVEINRRCIPPLDCHPCDVGESKLRDNMLVVNQCIAKPFEQWNVVDVLNLSADEREKTVTAAELGLDGGEYLLFEFWGKEFCGVLHDSFTAKLRPYQSKVYSVRKLTGVPQIVCTSRHISAGGVDLKEVRYDEQSRTLFGESEVIADEEYTLYIYDPASGKVISKSFMPEESQLRWEVKF